MQDVRWCGRGAAASRLPSLQAHPCRPIPTLQARLRGPCAAAAPRGWRAAPARLTLDEVPAAALDDWPGPTGAEMPAAPELDPRTPWVAPPPPPEPQQPRVPHALEEAHFEEMCAQLVRWQEAYYQCIVPRGVR